MDDKSHETSSSENNVESSTMASKVDKLNHKLNEHRSKQAENPFSASHNSKDKKQLKAEEYGRPQAGSLTEARGKKANVQVYKEIIELCQVIHINGKPSQRNPDLREIHFGELFDIYVYISNKVAGLLLRARKYELLTFEGEMLFQKYHDNVPITLLHPMSEIKNVLSAKQDEVKEHGCKVVLK